MVTEISGAALSRSEVVQSVVPMMEQSVNKVRPDRSGVLSVADSRVIDESYLDKAVGAFSQMQNRQETFTEAASVVREVSETADKANKLLNKMEEDLGALVKMFPPYPIDNPERISLLNSFGGMKKLIDDLSFPPPEKVGDVGRLLSVQDDAKVGQRKELGKELGKTSAEELVKEPMWEISTLNALSASDTEVSNTLDQVKSTKQVLEDLKANMWNDVVDFVKQVNSSAVESKSREVRSQLADLVVERGGIGLSSIGRDALQLEQAAESR